MTGMDTGLDPEPYAPWRPNPQAIGESKAGQDPAPFATDKDRLEYFAGVLQSSRKYLVFPVSPMGIVMRPWSTSPEHW